MKVNAIPIGFSSVTPYLIIDGASLAIEFYKAAFGAKEIRRMEAKGKIMHSEILIGNAHIMVADAFPEQGFCDPKVYGGSPAFVHLYVEDAESLFANAILSGATQVMPVSEQFFGDQHGILKDPFGHTWTVATHMEDVTIEMINSRIKSYTGEQN
jgi:PhnB protein